jgi:hypothetical protein
MNLAFMPELKTFSMKLVSCPDCGGPLKREVCHTEGEKIVAMCSCASCTDGIDKDWEVIYSKENGVEKIKRYFWG